ncbi:MAG TPA: phage/plasmid primase, P4 family [Gemmataceae bacterium]|jgi:putative DNA primase/helicase
MNQEIDATTTATADQGSGSLATEPQARGDQTDWTLAQKLVRFHGHDLRYVSSWKSWLVWDGKRWVKDDTNEADRRVKQTIHDYRIELKKKIDRWKRQLASLDKKDSSREGLNKRIEKLRKKVKFSTRLESHGRMSSILSVAQSEPGVTISEQELDRDNWSLNVLNGTLDLRTGVCLPHRREEKITKLAPVEYDPEAKCPTWETFLETITGGSKEKIDYLRRAAGYCLTGDVSEQVLFFFYGSGSNGKTTFITALQDIMGEYAIQASNGLLIERRYDAHPTELADLFGRRLAVCTETKADSSFNESLVKQLTGGDRIRARRMREDFWEFSATHKIIIAGNHRPNIVGTDDGIWRRIHLVPFETCISEGMKDPQMPDKLRKELSGIMAWAVRGCLEWQKKGLQTPPAVKEATKEYRAESDEYRDFFEEVCEVGPDFRVSRKELKKAFDRWRKANSGDKNEMADKQFTKIMQQRGYRSSRGGSNGSAVFHGIRLRQTAPH